MIKSTEQDLMNTWSAQYGNIPLVTVRCTTFNHRAFINRCLDSLIGQQTTFPFRVLVHDDASTDGTDEIIKHYEKKYPHILKVIYEEENQYKKKDGSVLKAITPYILGKYVAVCEGDDYWCDNHKLQKQFEFMETHNDCSMCVHNTFNKNLERNKKDTKFNYWDSLHKMTEPEVFFGWHVHTSSYFYRSNINFRPHFREKFWSGDYAQLTLALFFGDIYCLPDIMSVYNAHNPNGLTAQASKSYDIYLNRTRARIEYLNEYNEYTSGKFDEIVNTRIAFDIINCSDDKCELLNAGKIMSNSKYNNLHNRRNIFDYLKFQLKYKGYIFSTFWIHMIRIHHRYLKHILFKNQ
jgi:glycosyltransferase involved in cell wall biosynthesis